MTHPFATPLEVLIATMDGIIGATGADPRTVSTDDKIMLAVQYVEVAYINATPINPRAGRVRL